MYYIYIKYLPDGIQSICKIVVNNTSLFSKSQVEMSSGKWLSSIPKNKLLRFTFLAKL